MSNWLLGSYWTGQPACVQMASYATNCPLLRCTRTPESPFDGIVNCAALLTGTELTCAIAPAAPEVALVTVGPAAEVVAVASAPAPLTEPEEPAESSPRRNRDTRKTTPSMLAAPASVPRMNSRRVADAWVLTRPLVGCTCRPARVCCGWRAPGARAGNPAASGRMSLCASTSPAAGLDSAPSVPRISVRARAVESRYLIGICGMIRWTSTTSNAGQPPASGPAMTSVSQAKTNPISAP